MFKKIRVLVLTIIIILMTTGMSNAITGNPGVDWLVEQGYVTGDSGGFRLNDNITRAEATKMIVEAAGFGDNVGLYKNLVSMFKDMNQKHWANGYVNVATINTLVNGYTDGRFLPNNNITYAEVIKMLVMANKDIPDTSTYSGSLWAVPYIVKADEVGITKDVVIKDHYAPATREKVFEMVFNTMFKEEPTFLEKYNGIIVANERVSRLDDEEVSFIIYEDLNRVSGQDARFKKGEIIELVLPYDVEDVEYLLGKVVDLTIDNNNVIREVKIDKSYSYLEGPILAFEDQLYLGTNGSYYRTADDLQIYHNDEDYSYLDYIYDLGARDDKGSFSFLAEYARITTKNGRLYFVDSFTFNDIALINKVNRSGNEIVIYNDKSDSDLKTVRINDAISYTYDWGFESMDLSDIREGDVIHIYDNDKAIVRRDSTGKGQLNDLPENNDYYYADIDDELYQIRITDYRRPVYTVDNKVYGTLYAEDLDDRIVQLIDKKIIYKLDINGHIQAILLN